MASGYKYRKSFTFEGRRYDVYANTQRELYEKIALKKRDLEEGRITYGSGTLVRSWAMIAIDTYKHVGERTKKEMVIRAEKHILSRLGNLPIGKVKPIQCQQVLNDMEGLSKSYITKVQQDMAFIFQKALENKLILENPAANLSRPKGHTTKRRSITDHERKHLLEVCERDPAYRLFLLMLYCGCRPAEAIEAEYRDIMVVEGIRSLHIRGTKTENSDRIVPLPIDVGEGEPFQPICPNSAGRKHSESSYKRLSSRLRRDMNISMGCRTYRNKLVPPYPLADDFVPYCLRHTYCTDLQSVGIDIRIAQQLMGHSDISTTANIYTHNDAKSYRNAGSLLGAKTEGCGIGCGTTAQNPHE